MTTPNSAPGALPQMWQNPGSVVLHLPRLPGVEAPAQCPQCSSARRPYEPDWFYDPEDGWYACGAVLIPEDGWMIEEEPCFWPPLRHTIHLLHHWLLRLGADAADAAAALAPIVPATPPIGWMEGVFLVGLGYCHEPRNRSVSGAGDRLPPHCQGCGAPLVDRSLVRYACGARASTSVSIGGGQGHFCRVPTPWGVATALWYEAQEDEPAVVPVLTAACAALPPAWRHPDAVMPGTDPTIVRWPRR